MRKTARVLIAVLTAILVAASAAVPATAVTGDSENFSIADILIDGEENLMGTDNQTPVFSWKMLSDRIGAKQTAYQIEVKKASDGAVVWNSGKVADSASVNIAYDGDALQETTRYSFTVSVWDESGAKITSNEQFFETAYFDNAFSDAKFIKIPEAVTDSNLHYTVEADLTMISDAAAIVFSASGTSNMFAWQFNTYNYNGKLYLRPHIWKDGNVSVNDIEIEGKFAAADFIGKENHITLDVYSDKVDTYIGSTLVNTYPVSGVVDGMVGIRVSSDGKNHEHALLDNVKVTNFNGDNKTEKFYDFEEENMFSCGKIVDGKLNCDAGSGTATYVYFDSDESGVPVFRKSMRIAKTVESARLYSTALGIYDVFINGERVGTGSGDDKVYDEFKPGWSNYNKRVLYHTYDVTDYIIKGNNVFTGIVASGWWNGEIAHGTYGSNDCAFMAKIVLTFSDGSQSVIATDESWSTSRESGVRFADIYNGETFDARYGDGFMKADYDDSTWSKAEVSNDFTGVITAFNGSNIRIDKSLTRDPERITVYEGTVDNGSDFGKINVIDNYDSMDGGITVQKGQHLLIDMGQNMVGWPEINVKAESGTYIFINFAEMLNDSGKLSRGNDGPEGSIYTANYRSARSQLKYIAAGGDSEVYSPTMTYFGFRYLELTANDTVTVYGIKGEVVTCDAEQTGYIETSNQDVNQLFSNIMWGQRGNYFSTPTDCPQRDERLGWSGDTQIFVGAAVYNADVNTFYHKWMDDAADSQFDNGAYPSVIPGSNWVGGNAGAWSDVGIIAPYTIYEAYGDISVLESNYDSMEKYMNFLDNGTFDGADAIYGDWLSYEGTPSRLVSVAYYAYDAALMRKIALALGKDQDAAKYYAQFGKIKESFIARYVNDDGSMNVTSQTAYLLALRFDLLPNADSRQLISEKLIEKLKKNNNQLSTGFVGTGIIAQTLSEIGNSNQAYSLLLTDDDPSWLYSVHQGATTVWERWNSYTISGGFGDVSMNSFNHYAYGAVAEWMYESMLGIKADEAKPGFSHFFLEPQIDTRSDSQLPSGQKNITHATGTYNSKYGVIGSGWSTEDNLLDYSAVVPSNSSATLTLPIMSGAKYITINSKKYSLVSADATDEAPFIRRIKSDGVKYVSMTTDSIVLELSGGSFDFSLSDDPPVIPGDTDFDGNITVSDVVRLRQMIMNGTWSKKELMAGDMDSNEVLSVSDVIMLRQKIMQG